MANAGVEGDAKKLLRVLAGKNGAREGRPGPRAPRTRRPPGSRWGLTANGCTEPCGA